MPVPKDSRACRWTVLWMAVLGVALFVFWNIGKRAIRMQTAVAASTGQQAVAATPGAALKAVLELTSVGEGSAQGVVLEKEGENAYLRASQTLKVRFARDVNVVMGNLADVRKGAVVHVTGTVDRDGALQASRMVILTGYVSVH